MTTNQVFNDVAVITEAGLKTTRLALCALPYYTHSTRKKFCNDSEQSLSPLTLANGRHSSEYTVSLGGLRMSSDPSTRLSRIGPDRKPIYGHHRIPAGTPVGVTPVLLHVDETLFPERRNFIPDRWMGPNGGPGLDKRFESFLKGTNACLGITGNGAVGVPFGAYHARPRTRAGMPCGSPVQDNRISAPQQTG